MPISEGTGEAEGGGAGGGAFSFYWIKLSHIGEFHILGKKVSLTAFRNVL